MVKKEIVVHTKTELTLIELCEICRVPTEFVYELVEYEIIHPRGKSANDWLFTLDELSKTKKAVRLRHDLEVNLAGVAVVLDLLEEMETLRQQMQVFEKYFSSRLR